MKRFLKNGSQPINPPSGGCEPGQLNDNAKLQIKIIWTSKNSCKTHSMT